MVALVGDENPFHVEVDVLAVLGHEKIERPVLGNVEERFELAGPFRGVVNGAERFAVIMGDVAVEFVVFLLGDLALRACPDGLHGVEGFFLGLLDLLRAFNGLPVDTAGIFLPGYVHGDGILDVIGIFLDD